MALLMLQGPAACLHPLGLRGGKYKEGRMVLEGQGDMQWGQGKSLAK